VYTVFTFFILLIGVRFAEYQHLKRIEETKNVTKKSTWKVFYFATRTKTLQQRNQLCPTADPSVWGVRIFAPVLLDRHPILEPELQAVRSLETFPRVSDAETFARPRQQDPRFHPGWKCTCCTPKLHPEFLGVERPYKKAFSGKKIFLMLTMSRSKHFLCAKNDNVIFEIIKETDVRVVLIIPRKHRIQLKNKFDMY
jgi:hypothetical protein